MTELAREYRKRPGSCARRRGRTPTTTLLLAGVMLALPVWGEGAWLQWGGPGRDFKSETRGLPAAWPEEGPSLVWKRQLGDGYSSILVEEDRLYTMYRRGEGQATEEVVIAADTKSGATVWETAYGAPPSAEMNLQYGSGPHATPSIFEDRLFTVGGTLRLHALDKRTGEILWAHDLAGELGAHQPPRGFGASPLVWGDLVIVTPGGPKAAVAAFHRTSGELVWKSLDERASYSSPILAEIDGSEQVIVALGPLRAGLDPATGEVLWELELRPEAGTLMSTQIWDPEEHVLFGSSAYADGSRAIRVEKQGAGFVAEELWYTRKMRVQHGTAVRIGDYVYGSSGDFGPTLLTALHVRTGELAFRQRGFAKANFLWADGKLLILDEDGQLALGTPSPEGIEIHARAQVLERVAWTVPTLVGTRLYLRDRKTMKAFDLGS